MYKDLTYILYDSRGRVLDSKKLTATPGTVKVIFLEPVQADKKTQWFENLEKDMNEVFNKEKN